MLYRLCGLDIADPENIERMSKEFDIVFEDRNMNITGCPIYDVVGQRNKIVTWVLECYSSGDAEEDEQLCLQITRN